MNRQSLPALQALLLKALTHVAKPFGGLVIVGLAASNACMPATRVFSAEPSGTASAPLKLKKVSEGFVYETAPFPSCHASTIEEAADGTLVSAWFGGEHEKADDVGIWISRLVDGKWTAPIEVANGVQFQWQVPQVVAKDGKEKWTDVQRYPTWNPVLFQPVGGPLLLFYKAGPNPDAWWGMLSESHDHGKTWSRGERLPEGILGPIKNKPIQLEDGRILCPSSNETPGDDDRWTVHFEQYDLSTKSWARTAPLNDGKTVGAIQPSLLRLGGSELLAIGRSRQGKLFEIVSKDNGRTWGEIGLIDLPNPNSGTDAVTLKSGDHVLIYNHVTKETQEWGGSRSPLNLAVSKDGKVWEPSLELENTPKKEFSYPAIIQTKDGKLHVTYTWHRLKIKHVVLEIEE